MSDKLAKLQEHSTVLLRDLGGNGALPSTCKECDGKLDFTRKEGQTVLQCRDCGCIIILD